jgi:NADPH-dependent 2,4-dienoyl-CoA reductase/sulfur reductase-like enzyme
LAAAGRRVILIEDNHQAGGQYFRQLPPTYRVASDARLLRETGRYKDLSQVLAHPLVSFWPSTVAWGAPGPLTLAYAGSKASGRVQAQAIVIATGAQDKPFPFTGWTLPGVMSAGGCLNLAKAHGLVPAGRVVVAGNGPLVLVAGATLAAAGAQVSHVIEAQPSGKLAAAALRGLTSFPKLLFKGMGYRVRMMRDGAQFMSGWMVTQARGDGGLQQVSIAPVAKDGTPDHSRQRSLQADTLVLGYGLLPGIEFARMMGCRIVPDASLGGWVPERSERLETSVSGVYAIGDGAGIGGVEVALLEGEQAAQSILGHTGKPGVSRRYRRVDAFRRALNMGYQPARPLRAAEDGTIVCRCEELTLGELRAHLANCDASLDTLKIGTRLGMGRCQGRNCLTSVAALCGLDDTKTEALAYPRVRPPVRPVPLQYMAADMHVGPAHEPDEINLFAPKETTT